MENVTAISEGRICYVVLAPNNWHGQWMNRQQLFSRIARTDKVIYSTGPMFSWQRSSVTYRELLWKSTIEESCGVQVVTAGRAMTRVPRYRFLDFLACKYFAYSLKRLNPEQLPVCLYIFHPSYADYARVIEHDLLVYHAYDDFSKQGMDMKEERQEEELVRNAHVVFASSRMIAQRLNAISGCEKAKFLPNGVDFSCFSKPAAVPDDFSLISSPRILYVGSINKKVDLALLDAVAKMLPNVNLVLVGPTGDLNESDKINMDALQRKANVFFLGNKDVSQIAAYMQHSDINLMAYKTDNTTWASAVYPLKLHEYLAVGKPVLSTKIDSVLDFSDVVHCVDGVQAWVDSILTILDGQLNSTPEQREHVARENDWDARVEVIRSTISSELSNKL